MCIYNWHESINSKIWNACIKSVDNLSLSLGKYDFNGVLGCMKKIRLINQEALMRINHALRSLNYEGGYPVEIHLQNHTQRKYR